jgi:hypothetical protein
MRSRLLLAGAFSVIVAAAPASAHELPAARNRLSWSTGAATLRGRAVCARGDCPRPR